MKLEPVANALDEPILAATAPSGLRVFVHSRPDWTHTFAAFGTNFGSVDRVSGADGRPVPEGLAHFLEHKLFEDQHGDVSDRFAELGASTNAMTGFCGTTYIMSAVAEAGPCLDLLLGFVQDPWFTDELVAKEQGIIAQEIRMYDDDPDWRIFFGLMECLYQRHPVRDNIAGTVESIAEIDAATLRRCYDLFYHPRNMCLVVSGAMSGDAVVERVMRDQSQRPVDTRPAHERVVADEPPGRFREHFEERLPVARPRWMLGIKETIVGGGSRELLRRELATRVLLDLLFGRSSPAFEALYDDGIVDETFGVSYSAEETFGFSTLGGDTDVPERLEERVRAVFAGAVRDGVDAGALGRIRNKVLGGLLRGLDSSENVAHGLITDCFRGLPPFAALELIDELTPEGLQARLTEHVRDDAMATATVMPATA